MKDLVYIYDKETLVKSELGEIQSNFNQNFVIDGTKDSNRVIVYNFNGVEVEPYTIIKHQATKTWWIVSHDKVTRYKNEYGYYYMHDLELQGAIELLNARDLTDSGFNQNRYTISQFFDRLLKHSNFELNNKSNNEYQIDFKNNIDPNKQCDYVKTYENYTLLSALRDLFDGYNCDIKLDFYEDSTHIIQALFYVVSKTGNVNDEPLSESVFNNIEENKTIDKNSFGTTVISNAENVISTKSKTFPTTGAVKITGTAYEINGGDNSTAVVRLPSDIFRVNWVDLYFRTTIWLEDSNGNALARANFYSYDDNSIQNAYNTIQNALPNDLQQDFVDNFPIFEMYNYGKRRIPYTDKYDAISYTFLSDYAIPQWESQSGRGTQQLVVTNSDLRPNIKEIDNAMFFERGKNLIEGISFFGDKGVGNRKAQLLPTNEGIVYSGDSGVLTTYYVGIGSTGSRPNFTPQLQEIEMSRCGFIVNYIPMADFKIKVDNSGTRKDSKLYNQNGKLTDSVALSKSLLSYSKEIESDTITKNGTFYAKYSSALNTYENNIPNVGRLVTIGSELYVINNVSLDFYQNECDDNDTEIGYYIKGEFTLSKNVATKSALVNPNTNIRDYGIPQDKNVARKQLYRDFYELGHSQVSDNINWYLPLEKVLNVGVNYSPYQDHIAVIKLEFNGSFGGTPQDRWFYQLESTTFILKKSIYEIIDFRDNNIIGYGSQNVYSGFDITRLLTNTYDYINTPISYVDDNGEFKSIDIKLCTNEQVGNVYEDYKTATGLDFSSSSYNAFYSCFIPSEIYGEHWNSTDKVWEDNNYGAKVSGNHDFAIIEVNYEKDALEVPVFEYSCQIDDSDQVLIGSNILDNYENDSGYLYQYLFVEKNKYNDNNYGLKRNDFLPITIDQNNVATMTSSEDYKGYCELAYDNGKLTIKLYSSVSLDLTTNTITSRGTQKAFDTNYDLMIIRNRILDEDLYHDIIGDLSTLNVVATSSFGTPNASDYHKYRVATDDNYYYCEVKSYSGTLKGRIISTDTTSYVDTYNNTSSFSENPQALVGSYLAVKEKTATITGATPLYIYTTYIENTSDMSSWASSYGAYASQVSLVALENALDHIPDEMVTQHMYFPFSITLSGYAQLNIYWKQNWSSIINGYATPNAVITNSGSTQLEVDIISYVGANGNETNVVFELVSTNQNYPRTSCSIVRNAINGVITYGPTTSFSLNNYSISQKDRCANVSGYYQQQWLNMFYPATNKHYIYYFNGSQWVRGYRLETQSDINSHGYNGVLYGRLNNATNNYFKTYSVSPFAWNDYTPTSYSEKWCAYVSSNGAWRYATDLANGFAYAYLDGSRQYYYVWNTDHWDNDTEYEWILGASATNEYFTYNNTLYQYNALTNEFTQKSSSVGVEREDLMFIIKDMGHADISSDILSLYINHYETD